MRAPFLCVLMQEKELFFYNLIMNLIRDILCQAGGKL